MLKVTMMALSHAQEEMAAVERRLDTCIDKAADVIRELRGKEEYEEIIRTLCQQTEALQEEKCFLRKKKRTLNEIAMIYQKSERRIATFGEGGTSKDDGLY